jgi:hypothetical protein
MSTLLHKTADVAVIILLIRVFVLDASTDLDVLAADLALLKHVRLVALAVPYR